MKTRLFIFGFMTISTLLVSCKQKPDREEIQQYLEELKLYYPYSPEEELVFINDELGQTWEAKAIDNKGTYPITRIACIDYGRGSESYGDWNVIIEAPMQEKGLSSSEYMTNLTAAIIGNTNYANILWSPTIRISDAEIYISRLEIKGKKKDIYSMLTDTVIIPLQGRSENGTFQIIQETAYARIVKHQGLTDFSTDGKTVWKRVKE